MFETKKHVSGAKKRKKGRKTWTLNFLIFTYFYWNSFLYINKICYGEKYNKYLVSTFIISSYFKTKEYIFINSVV